MGFFIIALLNIGLVVGGGEAYDKIKSKVIERNDKIEFISEEVQKKTRINIEVKPVINFNPDINVSPTIKSENNNDNNSINENESGFEITAD